ncbi:hypothetical protein [Stenotrophomonas phage BUCT603B1]|nr:hypothetical protein [Stenotrophomonas phage BUCT603]UOL49225.1 hypothetical protein [Stenotrophomonas phage BUCT603B1]
MKCDLDTDARLRGFDNITALSLGCGKLALAVAAPEDATTAMTVINRGDYDSDQEFGMEVVQWCRRHGEQVHPANRSYAETEAMRHAVELVS